MLCLRRMWFTLAAATLAVSTFSTSASAVDASCEALLAASNKVILGPAHLYMTGPLIFCAMGPKKRKQFTSTILST
jgi:hypothetical protein